MFGSLYGACPTPGFEGEMYWHGHDLEALRSSSRLAQEQASERKPIGTSTILRRFEDRRGWPQEQASEGKRTGSGTISRHFEARQACRRTGLGRKTYWQEHDRDALRGSSKLAQEQASEGKHIGGSTISRRFEVRRGLPQEQAKNKPRKENVLAAARCQGTSRLVKLAQEQASEGKSIGRSTIARRFEAHRGLPKNRPRKENVLARARS